MAYSKDILSFTKPSNDMYPSLMWFWNDSITKAGIREQLTTFARNGFHEIFIHPLWGLEVPYLTEEFFELIGYAIETMKELSLRYWIYDEYNWPSGTAAGKLLKDQPETRGSVLLTKTISLYPGQPLCTKIEGELVSAGAIYHNHTPVPVDIMSMITKNEAEGSITIEGNLDNCLPVDVILAYKVPSVGVCASGLYSPFVDYEPGWLDSNNADAVAQYIESTHEAYRRRFGDKFGSVIAGVFNDEANNLSFFDYFEFSRDGLQPVRCHPWSKDIEKEFIQQHGYSLKEHAYQLGCNIDSAAIIKTKFDFWSTISSMFIKNYLAQISGWCTKNGLIFTGHLSGEESVLWHAYQMGDSFKALSQFDIPGIDHLFSAARLDEKTFSLPAYIASSAAKLTGKERVLCETFSGSGWQTSMLDMKRSFYRLLMGGVNMFQYMGAYYSLSDGKKHFPLTYPPSHGANNTLFKHYASLNTMVAKLCALSADSVKVAEIVVVLPTISVYIDASLSASIDEVWTNTCLILERNNLQFDIVSESALESASLDSNGRLMIGDYAYSMVILPGFHYTSSNNFSLIKRMLISDTRMIAIGQQKIRDCQNYDVLDIQTDCAKGNARFIQSCDGLVSEIEKLTSPGFLSDKHLLINASSSPLQISKRESNDSYLYFLLNDTDQSISVPFHCMTKGDLHLLDTENDHIMNLPQNGLIDVQPYQLIAISLSKLPSCEDGITPIIPTTEKTKSYTRILDSSCDFRALGGNMLPLNLCVALNSNMLLGKDQDKGEHKQLDFSGIILHSFPEEFPQEAGLKFGDRYIAQAAFNIKQQSNDLKLFGDYHSGMEVYFNHQNITSRLTAFNYYGIGNRSADIADLSLPGTNTITIVHHVPEWRGPHYLPSFYLNGSFLLDESRAVGAIEQKILPYYWNKQGYPYYCGDGCYSFSVELQAFERVEIHIETEDAFSVYVNNRFVKTCLWQQPPINVTEFAVPGVNVIDVIVTSRLKNLAQPRNYICHMQGRAFYDQSNAETLVNCGLANPPVMIVTE